MSEAPNGQAALNLQEQIARIDNLLAATAKAKVETAWAPWQIVLTTFGATTAVFTAGATVMKLLWG